jgi:hypothetical protein
VGRPDVEMIGHIIAGVLLVGLLIVMVSLFRETQR